MLAARLVILLAALGLAFLLPGSEPAKPAPAAGALPKLDDKTYKVMVDLVRPTPEELSLIHIYHRVITSNARPLTVYACNASTGIPPPHHATVFRSDDGGESWQARYFPDPRYPGNNVEPDYTTVEDHQYYHCLLYTSRCV